MTATISDLSFGTSRILGRYFRLVSAVPTALLAAYLVLLIASGAWTHRPDFRAGIDALTSASVGKIIGLLGATLAVALVLHTVQFTLVQFLEGYWGGNRVMRFLRTRQTLYHLTRLRKAQTRFDHASDVPEFKWKSVDPVTPEARDHVREKTNRDDALKVIETYPYDKDHVMPTRLGNLLRKYEVNAGIGYEINILQKATHLALVAPENHVPYALAYVSYRGALVAATHYGDALAALVDLNRFGMYEKLHQRLPDDTIEERAQNILMSAVMAGLEPGGKPESVPYEHPTTPSAGTPTPSEEQPSG